MPLFCKICNNLLNDITTANEFYFKCFRCQQIYSSNDVDSLKYEDVKGIKYTIYKTLLSHAKDDPVNPKVYKDCKCGNNIVKQVRIGDDLRLINVCTKCNHQWIEGIEEE